MKISQVYVKLPLANEPAADLQDQLIPVFHRWIREALVPDHLLIDVADYRHVNNGPGVMLIAHEAHLYLDEGRGGVGLAYTRKRDEADEVGDKFGQALRTLYQCAALLENEGLGVRFATDRLLWEVRSRIHAEPKDFDAVASELDGPFRTLFGDGIEIRQDPTPGPLAAHARAQDARPLGDLIQSLGGSVAASKPRLTIH